MLNRGNFIHKLLCISTIVLAVQGNFVFAQGPPQKKSTPTASKCSGAWTGTVSYSRKQTIRDRKTTPRVTNGTDEKQFDLDYEKTAKVFVSERPGQKAQSIGNASVALTMSTVDKTIAKEKNSCDRGKTWQDMSGTFTVRTEKTGNGSGESNVSVGINTDGTYRVSVSIPQIDGKTSGITSATYKGQCTTKKGSTVTIPERPDRIDGDSVTSDGTHRVDGKDPNSLAGTYTFRHEGVVEKITWNLQRCGAPLRITDIKFHQPTYPGPNDWAEINDGKTVDGNLVQITATVANFSGTTKTADVLFKELKSGEVLPEGTKSERFDPNTETDVQLMWDTSGYAWNDAADGATPEMKRQIEVAIKDSQMSKDINVLPKPVITVPGLWSTPDEYKKFIDFFAAVPGTNWHVRPAKVNVRSSILVNAKAIDDAVREEQKELNAWHVDIAAHSSGGLSARAYINGMMPMQFDGRPTASHLVMIGTPNKGTPCAAGFPGIISRIFKRNADVISELGHLSMKNFNMMVKNRNGTKFTTIGGIAIKKTCGTDRPGDGAVTSTSARWNVKDQMLQSPSRQHAQMLGDVLNFKAVYKRFAVGPGGNHDPDVESLIPSSANPGFAGLEEASFSNRNYGARANVFFGGDNEDAVENDPVPSFTTGLNLAAKQSTQVAIPVKNGKGISVVFMAPQKVTVTLLDPNGNVAGKSEGGTPEAAEVFRSIDIEKAVTEGNWTLKIESTDEQEAEVAVVVYIDQLLPPK